MLYSRHLSYYQITKLVRQFGANKLINFPTKNIAVEYRTDISGAKKHALHILLYQNPLFKK